MTNPTHDTPALIHDAPALEALHDTIDALIANVNDDRFVPERFDSTSAALLAESDFQSLLRASSVIHRLGLWARYAAVSPESYVTQPGTDEPTDHSLRVA